MDKKEINSPTVDGQVSFLGLWRWRCVADFSIGTLRLESVLVIFSGPSLGENYWRPGRLLAIIASQDVTHVTDMTCSLRAALMCLE
jgi:hypothetical protein